jgi:hypothetical protein
MDVPSLVFGESDVEDEKVASAVDTNLAHFSFPFHLASEGTGKATSPILRLGSLSF